MTPGNRRPLFSGFERPLLVLLAAAATVIFRPALQQARQGAQLAACADNLRRLYIGMMMYADDHDGFGLPGILPAAAHTTLPLRDEGRWAAAYFPGADRRTGPANMFRCPSDPAGDKGWDDQRLRASYRLLFGTGNYITTPLHGNNHFYGWRMVYGRTCPIPNLGFLGRTVTYVRPDGRSRSSRTFRPAAEKVIVTDLYRPGHSRGCGAHGSRTQYMHPGRDGANILFADGRVAWRPGSEMRARYSNVAGGTRTVWW